MKVFDEKIRPILILIMLLLLAIICYSVGSLCEFLESDFYKKYLTKKVLPEPKLENELQYQREEGSPLR